MDILGPLPESEAGNSYILVVADYSHDGLRPMQSKTRRLSQWLKNSLTSSFSGSPHLSNSIQTKVEIFSQL